MPVVVVFTWYPPSKATEVGNVMQSIVPNPDDAQLGTNPLPPCFGSDENGIVGLAAYQPTEGNFQNLMGRIATTLIKFHDIEGFKYKIQVFSTGEEAVANRAAANQ
ncbi:MAG: hypothetical protein ACW98F_00595 [Candidatus Hodarchaeales archaeon]|jgi:hypothetical protein